MFLGSEGVLVIGINIEENRSGERVGYSKLLKLVNI